MTDIQAGTYLGVLLTVQVIVRVGHHQLLQTKRGFSIAVESTRRTGGAIDTAVHVSSSSLLNCEAQHLRPINVAGMNLNWRVRVS